MSPIRWTNDVFADEGLHYVTLHHRVEAAGEPVMCEPDKVREWRWAPWDAIPQPRFAASASLLDSGWRP